MFTGGIGMPVYLMQDDLALVSHLSSILDVSRRLFLGIQLVVFHTMSTRRKFNFLLVQSLDEWRSPSTKIAIYI